MPEYNFTFDWRRVTTIGRAKVLVEQVSAPLSQSSVNAAVAQYIEDHPGSLTPLSEQVKVALLQLAQKVWYISDTDGADVYDALQEALYARTLLSISAVFVQTSEYYENEDLDDLRNELTVTAYYDDGTSETVTAYTLSGTLTEGTSTITVTYSGQTATFSVIVSAAETLLYTIPGNSLEFKSLGFSAPNYGSASTTRISYMPFDLVIEYGKTYRIVADTDVATADMSVHIYNETAYNNAQNNQNITNSNVSYTWKGTVDWQFTAGNINSKPAKCIRLSFRPSTSDPTITENFINDIKIYEVHT